MGIWLCLSWHETKGDWIRRDWYPFSGLLQIDPHHSLRSLDIGQLRFQLIYLSLQFLLQTLLIKDADFRFLQLLLQGADQLFLFLHFIFCSFVFLRGKKDVHKDTKSAIDIDTLLNFIEINYFVGTYKPELWDYSMIIKNVFKSDKKNVRYRFSL